jgi:hypothetical protein
VLGWFKEELAAAQECRDGLEELMRVFVGSCAGMLAVGLGAYGTHMFKPTNPTNKDVSIHRVLVLL